MATKKHTGRLSFLQLLALAANVAVVLALITGFFAAYVPPSKYWIPAFIGLAFPYLLIVNLFFILFWFFTRRSLALLPLIVTLICWQRISGYFQTGLFNDKVRTEHPVDVMTYNVRLFDLYKWKNNKISEDASAMLGLIASEKPDVLFIQEYHAGRKGKVTIADSIRKYSGLKYSHLSQVLKKGKTQPYGIATFSKWPIVSKGVIRFSSNPANVCIFTDIVHYKDTIRLFNIHLESIQFSREDYLFVNDLKNNADEQEEVSVRLRSMARKLKAAFISRSVQAQKVADEIERSPYPVIVSGDFNDTPSSYAYHRISHGLADAFIRSGRGISQTYAGPFPSFRIDYILYDQDRFAVSDYRKINQKYSDHLPVKARLYLLSDE